MCVCCRYVAGAARSCAESDAAGRGHADRCCGESPQSPAAGTGAKVHDLPPPVWGSMGVLTSL